MILQGRDGILNSITIWRTNSFLWKDLKTALHPIFLIVKRKLAHVVFFFERWCLWDILRVTLKLGECEDEVIDEARNKDRKVSIGAIINKVVGFWYQLKIKRRIQNYHPVLSGNPPSPAPLDPACSHMLVSSYTSFCHCHRLTDARVGSRLSSPENMHAYT